MEAFARRLAGALAARHDEGLYRHRLTLDSAQGPLVRVDGVQSDRVLSGIEILIEE